MKKSRVLALMLVVAMIFSMSATFVVSAEELTPPANSKVRVTEKTVTQVFEEGKKVWDIWDTQGNFGTYDTNGNVLNIKGGDVPFIALSGFGSNLENVNEIVVEYKTASTLTVQLRIREKGSSTKVELPATNGEYVKASLNMTQFAGGGLTDEDLKAFKSVYNATTGKYDATAMLYLGSSDASIKSLNAYWYSYSSESTTVRKEMAENFENTTWASWGSWTGGGSTSVPLEAKWEQGANENGTGYALTFKGGNTGSGSYAGAQYAMPGSFDLTAVDGMRFRYKSTAGIKVMFQRAYQIEVGETIPAPEREIIKGLCGDTFSEYFDENYKCIKRYKKESGGGGSISLPSTNGEWKTSEVYPIAKFGSNDFLKTMKTVIANKSFAPNYMLRFEGMTYGDFATTGKYFTLGGVTGVWLEKLPTMSSISFTKNGAPLGYLEAGAAEVNVELDNASNVDIEDSVLIAAVYERGTNNLLDIAVKLVDTPALGKSGVQTLALNVPASAVEPEIRVMLWDAADSMNQITNIAYFDAYGYFTE